MSIYFFFQLNRATVHNPLTGQLEFAKYRISKKYVSTHISVKSATKSFFLQPPPPSSLSPLEKILQVTTVNCMVHKFNFHLGNDAFCY